MGSCYIFTAVFGYVDGHVLCGTFWARPSRASRRRRQADNSSDLSSGMSAASCLYFRTFPNHIPSLSLSPSLPLFICCMSLTVYEKCETIYIHWIDYFSTKYKNMLSQHNGLSSYLSVRTFPNHIASNFLALSLFLFLFLSPSLFIYSRSLCE